VRPECSRCSEPQPQRQRFAFTAVCEQKGWIIGRADEGTRGYTPKPEYGVFAHTDERKARDKAAELNKEIGWTSEGDAQMVVLRTMAVKEDHLAGLLGQAVTMLQRVVDEDKFVETDEITTFIDEDCKGYAKEPA
jgi:hypothetical protein